MCVKYFGPTTRSLISGSTTGTFIALTPWVAALIDITSDVAAKFYVRGGLLTSTNCEPECGSCYDPEVESPSS